MTVPRPAAVVLVCAAFWIPWGVSQVIADRVDLLPRVGLHFLEAGRGQSETIDRYAVAESPVGYDGQMFLYIAMDPIGAEAYLDRPGYRYARIVYPLAARAMALGRGAHTALALLTVGIIASLVGAWAVARYLVRDDVSAWYALIYGLSPALAVAVQRDVAEPLAWALAALGLLVLAPSTRRIIAAATLFCAAALTHEATLVVPVAVALALATGCAGPSLKGNRNVRTAIVLLGLSLAPVVVWRVVLTLAVGDSRPGFAGLEPLPFAGLIRAGWPTGFNRPELLYAVVLPAVIGLTLVLLARGKRPGPALFVLAFTTLFVLSLPKPSLDGFGSAGRLGLGTVMAFVMCIPFTDPARRALVVIPPVLIWGASWMLVAGDFFRWTT